MMQSQRHLQQLQQKDFSLENIPEEEALETYEQKLERATKHFTSKDQLLPFIPLNPDIEPDEDQPFSEDEAAKDNPFVNPDIDYEKVLDPDFGFTPKQQPTVLVQEH